MAETIEWRNRIIEHGVKPASQFMAHPSNWRKHPVRQRKALKGSLDTLGWVAPVLENRRTGYLIDGHERVWQALQNGDAPVPYIVVDLDESEEAQALLSLDAIAALAQTDAGKVDELLRMVETGNADVQQFLSDMAAESQKDLFREDAKEAVSKGAPDSVNTIDIIWTQTGVGCCLATHMGWLYGIQSGSGCCPCALPKTTHKVVFVDNEYKSYNHAKHLKCVSQYRPKYATVRDVMTEAQCADAGIEYYQIEQILDWAEELTAYADNVILVPKYDCLDQIPDKFMLGYSVPTSYGGTPLPIEAFAGRRIHLLGGNPEMQIKYYSMVPESVVSLDNNQMHLRATFGNTWTMGGYVNLQHIPNLEDIETSLGLWPSVAISLASFASWFRRDSGTENPD